MTIRRSGDPAIRFAIQKGTDDFIQIALREQILPGRVREAGTRGF